ncbi:MAG: dTDP-4-dehydrorhamnose reductase [Myxococcales bacterium]|nr:dTDP-4-dehydrorhamnose reductase [Myxococcales bacterium]
MREKLLLIGAGGNLGRSFCRVLDARGERYRAVDYPEVDVRDPAHVEAAIAPGTELVINCSAYTDVDGAESAIDAAMALNAEAPGRMAARCAELGARYVDFGTDYVFNGKGEAPYPVDGEHNPCNAYGRSKAAGEKAIAAAGGKHLIVRTSWLYAPWGKNFVLTIAKLARENDTIQVVDDQRGRPTSAIYLAQRALQLLDAGATGIYHGTDGGECTWFDFASAIVEGLRIDCKVEACGSHRYPRPAVRPAYSVLDLSQPEALIGPSRSWRENLADVLRQL